MCRVTFRVLSVMKLIKKLSTIIYESNISDTINMPGNSSKETKESNNVTKITLIDTII